MSKRLSLKGSGMSYSKKKGFQRLSQKFSFVFYVSISMWIFHKHSYLGQNLLCLSKKRPKKLEILLIPNFNFIGKIQLRKNFGTFWKINCSNSKLGQYEKPPSYQIVKEIKFKEVWDKLESRKRLPETVCKIFFCFLCFY